MAGKSKAKSLPTTGKARVVFTSSKHNPQNRGPVEGMQEEFTKRDMGDRHRSSKSLKLGGSPTQKKGK